MLNITIVLFIAVFWHVSGTFPHVTFSVRHCTNANWDFKLINNNLLAAGAGTNYQVRIIAHNTTRFITPFSDYLGFYVR